MITKNAPNIKKCPSGGKFTHGWEPLIIQYLEHNKNFKSQIRVIVDFNVGKNDNWRLVAQTGKNSPAKQAPGFNPFLAWRIARTEETGGLQWGCKKSNSTELLTCAHTRKHTHTHTHTQREVDPLTNLNKPKTLNYRKTHSSSKLMVCLNEISV